LKFLMITECKPEEMVAMLKKDAVINADREKNPENYPKTIAKGLWVMGEWPKLSPDTMKGFDLVEADSVEQVENHVAFWSSTMIAENPSLKKIYVPLLDASKLIAKMKM
jgi:hypothetical protein